MRYFFNIDVMFLRARRNGFAGRIWPVGRSLKTSSFANNQSAGIGAILLVT